MKASFSIMRSRRAPTGRGNGGGWRMLPRWWAATVATCGLFLPVVAGEQGGLDLVLRSSNDSPEALGWRSTP